MESRSATARQKRHRLMRVPSPCLKNTAALRALPTTPTSHREGIPTAEMVRVIQYSV